MPDTALIEGHRSVAAGTRGILWFFFAAALLVGLASLVVGAIGIIQHLASGYTELSLVAHKPLPATPHSAGLFLANGQYPSASVEVRGLSDGVVALVTTAAVATVLIEISLSALVALLSWRLLRGGVFRRSLSRAVSAAGFILAAGGTISQAGIAVAGGAAAAELNGGGNGFWPLAGTFDPTLVVFGIVLLLVALAFEYGTRLQRDSDGLV